jgi:hypothetical protein
MLGLAPSAGAFAWGNPVTVAGASQHASFIGAPRVATDSNGDLMVAWLSNATLDPAQSCPCVVRAAFRPAGGSFGSPVDVSPAIANPEDALEVQLAMDAAGDSIVGYTAPANPSDKNALPDTVYAAIRPAGGSFGAPQVVATPGGPDGASLNYLKMDAAGDAIAAVNNQQPFTGPGALPGDTVFDAVVVTGSVSGGFDSAHPQILSTGTEDAYPRALSMSPNGHAVIALETRLNDQENDPDAAQPIAVEYATSSGPSAPFVRSSTLIEPPVMNPEFGSTPEMVPETAAINDTGDFVVGYTDFINDSTSQAKASINGGAPTVLNPAGDNASTSPRVVINPSGESVAVVADSNSNPAVSVRPAGGSFPRATTLTGFQFGSLANAANLPSGNGDVVYSFDGDDNSSVEGSIRPAGGSFASPTALAPDDDDPAVSGTDAAIDPAGNAAVTWVGPDGSVRAAIGDASAPTPGPGPGGGGTPPKIGAPKVNAKNGTAKLPVVVDGAGKVVLTGNGIKNVTQSVSDAKTHKITLVVKPVGALAKKLKKAGTAKVKVKVTFTPTGGKASSSTKTLKLVEKR